MTLYEEELELSLSIINSLTNPKYPEDPLLKAANQESLKANTPKVDNEEEMEVLRAIIISDIEKNIKNKK